MKYYFLIVVLFISFLQVDAQNTRRNRGKSTDDDKSKYEKEVFNKEMGEEQDKQNHQRMLDLIPEKLPNWFFNPVSINPYRFIGISDPGLNRDEAYKQAIIRAKAMYALINFTVLSNIADDYTNLRESGNQAMYETKFQDFTVAKAKVPYNNKEISIIDTFYTKYGEGIILVEIIASNQSNPDTIEVKGEHLQTFTERGNRKEKIEFFNLMINDSKFSNDSVENSLQYNFRKLNRNYDVVSQFGSRIIELPERSFNYQSEIEFVKDSTDTDFQANIVALGLWNAYLCGILDNFTTLSKQLASKVKNSNDFYTLKNEGLIRTVARSKAHFEVNKFKLIKNEIYIDLYGEIRR